MVESRCLPPIGQDRARGSPLVAPRGTLVHHQHERLEHAHVLLSLGHQVGGGPLQSCKPGYEYFVVSAFFALTKRSLRQFRAERLHRLLVPALTLALTSGPALSLDWVSRLSPECRQHYSGNNTPRWVMDIAANDPSVFTITEKAPTRTFSWLKAPTTAFTYKTLLGD